jgi:hypothetical protein
VRRSRTPRKTYRTDRSRCLYSKPVSKSFRRATAIAGDRLNPIVVGEGQYIRDAVVKMSRVRRYVGGAHGARRGQIRSLPVGSGIWDATRNRSSGWFRSRNYKEPPVPRERLYDIVFGESDENNVAERRRHTALLASIASAIRAAKPFRGLESPNPRPRPAMHHARPRAASSKETASCRWPE